MYSVPDISRWETKIESSTRGKLKKKCGLLQWLRVTFTDRKREVFDNKNIPLVTYLVYGPDKKKNEMVFIFSDGAYLR